jgi:hypothetical protein
LALAVWFHKNAKGELWLEQLCQFHKKLTMPHMTFGHWCIAEKKQNLLFIPSCAIVALTTRSAAVAELLEHSTTDEEVEGSR